MNGHQLTANMVDACATVRAAGKTVDVANAVVRVAEKTLADVMARSKADVKTAHAAAVSAKAAAWHADDAYAAASANLIAAYKADVPHDKT